MIAAIKALLGVAVLAVVLVLLGSVISNAGYQTIGMVEKISWLYAAIGFLWLCAGPAMVLAGLWAIASVGRNAMPLWIGGVAALLAGGALVAGVLTYVVPCSGPD